MVPVLSCDKGERDDCQHSIGAPTKEETHIHGHSYVLLITGTVLVTFVVEDIHAKHLKT